MSWKLNGISLISSCWKDEISEIMCLFSNTLIFNHILSLSLSLLGHQWHGPYRKTGLAECYDLRHCYLQVFWDLSTCPFINCHTNTTNFQQLTCVQHLTVSSRPNPSTKSYFTDHKGNSISVCWYDMMR